MTKTLQEACADEDFELVEEIIESSPFMVEALYEDIRLASFNNVKNRHRFNEICNQLKLKIKSRASANVRLPSVKTEFSMNLKQGWVNLFQESKPRDCKQSKEIAIKNTLVKFYLLLLSPTKCIPYLNHLSAELDRYIREATGQSSQVIDPSSYVIAPMSDHYFPVPNQHFVDPPKHNFLKEFLFSILRAQGLGKNAYT